MSKLNQIQNAIQELEGGAFQKLAASYLYKKGYTKLNAIGSVIGSNKTKTGTPDVLNRLPNGKYIFQEHTTQKVGALKKLQDDLEKCFDESKTGIPIDEIEEMVLIYPFDFEVREEHSLAQLCQSKGANLNLFGMSQISHDLYLAYLGLAQEFLGVSVDTGQIVPLEDFVATYNKNVLATPLDTNFFGRESELESLATTLETKQITVIAGHAGAGKSRLALEGCKRFIEANPDFELKCIFNRGVDLFQDLQVYFAQPGKHLIFVDDGNRLTGLDYIFQLLHEPREDRTIKIVITVRDYALEKVTVAARPYGGAAEIRVEELQDEQIAELIEANYNIRNSLYLDRIANISKGNPRLAIMAAQVAERDGTLGSLSDVSELYDTYYASIRQDLESLGNPNVLKVAGIIAFFRNVDSSNNEQMQSIASAFGIEPETFWKSAQTLHELEIVDMYENELVKASDQVLATYLFYLVFFKERTCSISTLLQHFFPSQHHKFADAIYPVLNTFDADKIRSILQPMVGMVWKELEEKEDYKTLLHLAQLFWFVEETKTLLYIRKRINGLVPQSLEISKFDFKAASSIEPVSLLGVLRSYQYSSADNLNIALELILDYAEKLPLDFPKVVHLLTEDMGFQHDSYLNRYFIPRAIEGALWKRTQDGTHELFSRLYLATITKFLHISFHTSELRGMVVHTRDFGLPATPEILSLRQDMWSRLFILYQKSNLTKAALSVVSGYCASIHGFKGKEILASDAEQLLALFSNHLDLQNYTHCLLVHDFLSLLDRLNVTYDQSVGHHFENETFRLSKVLASNRLERKELELGYEEYNKYLERRILKHFAEYTLDDYKKFFDLCQVIVNHSEDNKLYQFQMRVEQVYLSLATRDKEFYVKVFEYYLNLGDPLYLLYIYRPLRAFIDIQGVSYTKSILENVDVAVRNKWLFSFYSCLSSSEITLEHLTQLLDLYAGATLKDIPRDIEYLNNYGEVDKSIFLKVIHLILDKAEEEPRYASVLERLFNPHSSLYNKLPELFADDIGLLEKAYIAVTKVESYLDHDGKTLSYILDRDKNFVTEFISQLFPKEGFYSRYEGHLDFSFIWHREDHLELMKCITHFIYDRERNRYGFMTSCLEAFFVCQSGAKNDNLLADRQDTFLLKLIEENFADDELIDLVFDVISEFAPERRVKFVSCFVKNNKSFNAFKRLSLQPSQYGGMGSMVPAIQARAEYLESLLPVLNVVDLLEHKQYLEQEIRFWHKHAEEEKKRDFLEEKF